MTQTDEKPEALIGVRGYRVRNPAKARERQAQILVGAARAFARRGYEAANLEDIASETGLAKGHIYHYFLSKEHIFTEIRATAVSQAIEELEAIVASVPEPEAALRAAISHQIAGVFRPIERFANVFGDSPALSEENRNRIRRLQQRYEKLILEIVERGIKQGVFVNEDPKLMMFTLLRAAISVALWYRPRGKWNPEYITEKVTDQLMRSVQA